MKLSRTQQDVLKSMAEDDELIDEWGALRPKAPWLRHRWQRVSNATLRVLQRHGLIAVTKEHKRVTTYGITPKGKAIIKDT